MADISRITLPGGSAYDLKDAVRGVEFIKGTQTAATGSWTGKTNRAALFDGMQIKYFLPYAGSGNATLNLTLSGGTTTGAKPVYRWGTTYATTHFKANSVVDLTYSTKAVGTGAWYVSSQYDDGNTTYSVATTSANGLMSSTDKGIVDTVKYKVSLTALTSIPANSDLNDTKWLKTGSYANPLSANTSTISNIPSGLTEAFMLNVYSPLSGNSTADVVEGNWIYRVQELTAYGWKKRWARMCSTNGSGVWGYPAWTQIYPATVATGDANGQVKIDGTNVSVKGLGSAAYVDTETTVANDAKLPTGAAVKSFVEGKGYVTTDTNNRKSFYGTCATAAATKDKVVTLADTTGWELLPGTIVGVKFTNTNTYSSSTSNPITLNVNGTGAKNIWYNNTHSGAGNTGTNTTAYGYANRLNYYMYDGTYWTWIHVGVNTNGDHYTSAQCETAAATAAKTATCTNYTLWPYTYLHFNIRYTNTAASALTMNVNSQGAKPIYINGTASSSSNYTLHAGTYIALYNGTYWDFRTNGDPSCNSTMLYEDTLWNGVQLRIWASNRVVTAVFSGSESAATSGGSVAAYAQLDSYYAPRSQIKKISPDQNGKRFITLADTYGKVGIYWQLDTTTSTTEFYDVITWSY